MEAIVGRMSGVKPRGPERPLLKKEDVTPSVPEKSEDPGLYKKPLLEGKWPVSYVRLGLFLDEAHF